MNEVAILGVAMHPWGKIKGKSVPELNLQVAQNALKDAGLEWRNIQFVVAGADPWSGVDGLLAGCRLSQKIGNNGIPVVNVYNACATGGYALKTAQAYINSGFCDYVLVVAASISPDGFFGVTVAHEEDPNDLDSQRFRILGLTNPTGFAFMATYRMHHYGMTENDLALVKVKNSKFGSLNPLARFKKAFTVDDVLKSPMVTYPLRLYELCATSDGAAAIVLSSMKAAKKHARKPVRLASVGIATPKYPDPRSGGYGLDIASDSGDLEYDNGMGVQAAKRAYEEAGIGPEDLDLAEVYDLSSAFELGWYEEIGLCRRGDAEKMLRDGDTGMGGRIPVNTSGGCASFGEAIPAQAMAQVCELTWQMRGESGPRQVDGAKVGFTINAGKQGNCSATVIKR